MLYVDVDAAETAAVSVCTGLSYLTLCSIYLWRTHTLSTHTTHAIAHGIHHLHQRHTVYVWANTWAAGQAIPTWVTCAWCAFNFYYRKL